MAAESLYPPHSRLFVACDKGTTEQELQEAFKPYGTVQKVQLCRDRTNGAPKGFAFVQFDKTSEAAKALEALNGNCIGRSPRPIKVTVAVTKELSGTPTANDTSQFLRLFLVVPKTITEDNLHEYFSCFGAVDNVSIVKDRETKESKGYAYVKFRKFIDAALAYENCDRMYKVVFAKPKGTSDQSASSSAAAANPVHACTHLDDNPEGYTSILALVSAELSDDQIEWLFDIPPGLEYVRFFNDPPYMAYDSIYKRKVMVQYDCAGTAAYALRKLNGFEYPGGERVQVKPNYQFIDRVKSMERSGQGQQAGAGGGGHTVSSLLQQVESLTKNLSDATRLLNSAGIAAPGGRTVGQIEASRCTAKLPPPRPLAPPNSVSQERLFVVCEPGLPPQDALWDVFGRFGNLIDLYILSGKNCGYVKYADKNSAHSAVQTLNGQHLYRMKMKVLVAEPQIASKRPRGYND